MRKLSATVEGCAAVLRDPSQASSGSRTDTAANGLPLSLHRRLLRRRRTCAGTSSAICIAFSVAPLRKLSATIQSWAALLRDPSQASGGSGTDTAANGSPLSCTGVRRRRTCVSTSSAICIAFRAAPLRKLSATVEGCAAVLRDPSQASSGSRTDTAANGLPLSLQQASASSSTNVRRHKLRDLHRVQRGPFAQIVRDYPELGGAASGSVASIGRLRNGYSRKRLAFVLHRRPLRRRRTCAGTSSAICIAAAPLRKLFATIQGWAAILRDPSQASSGSGTDTAANGPPLSCTGVRFVVDERALAQAPRFASRQLLCASCPRLSRAGRRYFGIRRKHRAAPERIQPQTARLLPYTGVRFVIDGCASAQAPRFVSRSGQPLCVNCLRLPRKSGLFCRRDSDEYD